MHTLNPILWSQNLLINHNHKKERTMSTNDKSLPAFPSLEEHGLNNGCYGLTKREYFAASAPITVDDAMAACGFSSHSVGILHEADRLIVLAVLAKLRGQYADAMLVESER